MSSAATPDQAQTMSDDQVGWYDWQDEQLDEVSGVADTPVINRRLPVPVAGENIADDQSSAASVDNTDELTGDQGIWSRLTGAVGAVFGLKGQDQTAN